MPSQEIEEFARLLIQHVRDSAIRGCDMNLRPENQGPIATRWKEASAQESLKEPARTIIPDCVNATISKLLLAIDQGLLRVSFTSSTGKTIDLMDDGMGELTGWYLGKGGWCEKYSKERYVDDFSDLT
jgi:hypothetical protein